MLNIFCYLSSHARAFPCAFPRVSEKHNWFLVPFLPLMPDLPVKINNKFRVTNSFVQLVSNLRTVNMKKLRCKHCPIPGCHSKFLVRFANHITQVHELLETERKCWL